MTEKLYYIDAYIKEFTATVRSVNKNGESYDVVLDRTAFFPNEGGQEADNGTLGNTRVLDVREKCGEIIHTVDLPLNIGDVVVGRLEFPERYEKMKCHTAEHILCGIMHKLYGAENIGFHLGEDCVTLDVDIILTREQLNEVEDIANRIVSENIEIVALFPSPDELDKLSYRSKLDLTDGVRIVNIGEYDSCACCAPHVARTGEIGLIKMLDFCKHRGGTRIYMLAGQRALIDYRARYTVSQRISALTSTPQAEIESAVVMLLKECEDLTAKLKARGLNFARREAARVPETAGNAVYCFDDFETEELREFVNHAVDRVGGMLVTLTGKDGNYKYIIGSRTLDLKQYAKQINSALHGRGGGKSEMIQGSLTATLDEIKSYFEK